MGNIGRERWLTVFLALLGAFYLINGISNSLLVGKQRDGSMVKVFAVHVASEGGNWGPQNPHSTVDMAPHL